MRPSRWLRKLEDSIIHPVQPLRGSEGDENQRRITDLRARGVRIGAGCWILASEFSTEPYLIDIGDRVAISSGVQFVTHEGAAWLLRRRSPNLQVFGRIRIGDDSLIGMNCIILPGTTIGSRCVVGAGAVVKGEVANGTVVAGNPARFLKTTDELVTELESSANRLDIWHLEAAERERQIRNHFRI